MAPGFILLTRSASEIGRFFLTADLSEFVLVGLFIYLLGLIVPFVALLWVMTLKLFLGGDRYSNNVSPGVYPKWSRMHLRIWCVGRMEQMVLLTMRATYRSAPLMAFVLRQLGAKVVPTFSVRTMFASDRGLALHRRRCRDPDRRLHSIDALDGVRPASRARSHRDRMQNRNASSGRP